MRRRQTFTTAAVRARLLHRHEGVRREHVRRWRLVVVVVVQVHRKLDSGRVVQPPRGKGSDGRGCHLLLVAEGVRDDLTGALDILAQLFHVAF